MHSLEPELQQLHQAGLLDQETAARAIAGERGTVFSLYRELHAALYAAVAMIVGGVGLLLKDHLDRIGPLTIVLVIALAAAGCYGSALYRWQRGEPRSLVGDYVLLLGALLFSADVGYAELQFHWLGGNWLQYLLALAVWHAVIAYWLDSRLVLSVALSSLTAWFGIQSGPQLLVLSRGALDTGSRLLSCASFILAWSLIQLRLGWRPQLLGMLHHFAANLAFWGAIAWCSTKSLRWAGWLIAAGLAVAVVRHGLRIGEELFVVYGILYATIASVVVVALSLSELLVIASLILGIVIGAAVLQWQLHRRLREAP